MKAPSQARPHGLARLIASLARPHGLALSGPLGLASHLWRSAWATLRAQVLPGRCSLCAAMIPRAGLCPACLEALTDLPDDLCPGCGERLPNSTSPATLAHSDPTLFCPACREKPRPWDGLGFCGLYARDLRALILSLKFEGGLGRVDLLTGLLLRTYRQGLGLPGGFDPQGPHLVTAAPLHTGRLMRRGYNQSFELARLLARRLGRPASARALAKSRATTPQARLGQEARHENLRGVFVADPSLVAGRRVLVVDDVLTTGATLGEVSLALKAAGAVRVEALVLAKDKKIRA